MKKALALLLMTALFIGSMGLAANAEDADKSTLTIALSSAYPFSGQFTAAYNMDLLDYDITNWFIEPLLTFDDQTMAYVEAAASLAYDRQAQTVTLTMKEGVTWHDGEPVTLDDLVYAYEVLADPGYTGGMYAGAITYITGINDFHTGAADSIAGMALSGDEMTLTIHFDTFLPSVIEGSLWLDPLPRHYMGDLTAEAFPQSEKARAKALGFGPYKLADVVEGESVRLEAYQGYWQGVPSIDEITLTVVSPGMIPSAMAEGLYDIAPYPTSEYNKDVTPENFHFVLLPDRWYQYTGFHLGHFDAETGMNVTDPASKMYNVNLRKAIGYAVDMPSIYEAYYNGLRGMVTTVMPPAFAVYIDPSIPGYPYDPELAGQLLDEAGYLDINGDGFREDPAGEPLAIQWAVPNSNDETVAQYKIQCWADVGLHVELLSGNLMDTNAFYGMLMADDPSIDMFEAGWTLETNANVVGAWSRASFMNLTRFESDEMEALLQAIEGDAAWDFDARQQAYYAWENYIFENPPAIPTMWRTQLYAVSNRVQGFDPTPTRYALTRHLITIGE
ncbi:MAG: ABC transporter substrate-binding protein [Oscillospiraceae bacterium]|jgi:peptide/nickel transport system substrate-binding protein|nr:ABC transporter substrate-binding protein [Oscillospiraceae bacterium]